MRGMITTLCSGICGAVFGVLLRTLNYGYHFLIGLLVIMNRYNVIIIGNGLAWSIPSC